MSLSSYKHGVYQNIFHLVWATKYRYEMLRKEKYREVMEVILRDVAKRNKIEFVELSVMSDHVHALVDCHPSMSQSLALQLLKGTSSRMFMQFFPKMRLRYPKGHFWAKGKCGRTVGDVDQETVREYVKRQSEQKTLKEFKNN